MPRASGRDDEQTVITLIVESAADVLAGRPLCRCGHRRGKADPRQSRITVQQRDPIQVDPPAPQIARDRCGRWESRAGQRAIPLGPRGVGLVGEVPRRNSGAMLPAAVGRLGRFVKGIAALRDVPDEDVMDAAGIDVEGCHLRDWHALERRDEPRQAAVVAGPDDVDGTSVIESLDRLDQPDRDVVRAHDLRQPLD